MSAPTKMLSSTIEWLHDWMQGYEILPILLDEYHLEEWIQEDMLEALECFLHHGFRKQKTRGIVLEIIRGLLWEVYLFQREAAIHNLCGDKEAVSRLLALPQTAQKTGAWYAEARELLTGHEFATAVYGKGKTREDIIARKCGAEIVLEDQEAEIESRTVYRMPLSPFQWGWRFESVIRDLFESTLAGGKVLDTLGRIRHPTLPKLAASPDGIIVDGPKAGRLLEIKAPISRILKGCIPEDYYCQMQLQAEVTNVNAVEYIEVRFGLLEQYETAGDFLVKSDNSDTGVLNKMGVVLIVGDVEDSSTWTYSYSPLYELTNKSLQACHVWIPEGITQDKIVERSIWRVKDAWHTTVPRNHEWWFNVGKPAYEAFWRDVRTARAEGRFKSKLLLVESEEDD